MECDTLNEVRKFDNLTKVAETMKLDILGISEARLTGSGKEMSVDWVLYYSGGERYEADV